MNNQNDNTIKNVSILLTVNKSKYIIINAPKKKKTSLLNISSKTFSNFFIFFIHQNHFFFL